MKHTRKYAATGAALLLAATATACGDDSGGAADGDTIRIMSIAPTGTQATNFETAKVIQAYIDQLNESGGLGGKDVELIVCNDKYDPNEATNCAAQAVDEQVTAVVGGFSGFEGDIIKILDQASIPWIGTTATSADSLTSELSYPVWSGPLAFGSLGGVAAQTCDSTTPVLLDTASAASIVGFADAAMKQAGKEFNEQVKVAQTTVDFTSVAQSLKGSDCALVALPTSMYAPLASAMDQLKVRTRLLTTAAVFDNTVVGEFPETLEGSVVSGYYPHIDDPAWADAVAVIPSDLDMSGAVLQNSWVSMLVFDAVASSIDGDVTAATLKEALDGSAAVETGGLTPTLNFTEPLPMPDLARLFNTEAVNFAATDGKLVQQGEPIDLGEAIRAGAGG